MDVVLADPKAAGADALDDLAKAASVLGARLVLADVAAADGTPRHDPERLAQAYAQIFARAFEVLAREGDAPGNPLPGGNRYPQIPSTPRGNTEDAQWR